MAGSYFPLLVRETPLSNIHGEGSLRMMLRAGKEKVRGVSHHQDLWKEREMQLLSTWLLSIPFIWDWELGRIQPL